MIRTLTQATSIAMLAFVSLTAGAQQTAPDGDSTKEIRQVMDEYHGALVSHDGGRLARLFLPGSVWLNVLTDKVYENARRQNPETVKIKVGNYRDFAKYVSTTTKVLDPRHTNVVIHTNGTVAAVYFDFVFYVDGQPENQGSETWQLVKGTDGWRIGAISYSSEALSHPQK